MPKVLGSAPRKRESIRANISDHSFRVHGLSIGREGICERLESTPDCLMKIDEDLQHGSWTGLGVEDFAIAFHHCVHGHKVCGIWLEPASVLEASPSRGFLQVSRVGGLRTSSSAA